MAKKPTFEEALKRLEAIAQQIEEGTIGLEESIARYEEGMGLIKHCRETLSRAELRIHQLQADPQGNVQQAPFELPASPADPSSG